MSRRRRWTEDELTPVERIIESGARWPDDPRRSTRTECREAYSLDGCWVYARPGGRGSWFIRHEGTGVRIMAPFRSLDAARRDTFTGTALDDLADSCLTLLLDIREIPDPLLPVGDHDRARAALTWLAEHAPAALDGAVHRYCGRHGVDKVGATT